jgi:branched-chain amino acid transport system substrate-binding protein
MSCRLLAATLAVFFLAGCFRKPPAEPILIGHVAPFRGPDKAIGERAKQAILLAVEEVNKDENRVLGRSVAVLHPHNDPEELQPLSVRLITVDGVVALLGGNNAAEVEALGRAAQTYGVPVVTGAALPPPPVGENVFSVNASLARQGQTLARFAVRELKVDRVAVLVDSRRTEAMTLAAAFAREFSKEAATPVEEWAYQSEADLSALAQRVTMAQAKAVFHAGTADDLKKIATGLKGSEVNLPILYGTDGTPSTDLRADREGSVGVYLTTVYAEEGNTTPGQGFAKAYRERFHEAPDAPAAMAYDGARILFEALRRAKAAQPAKLRDELANAKAKDLSFESSTGPLFFDKDHSAGRPLFVVRLEEGRLKVVKRYDP